MKSNVSFIRNREILEKVSLALFEFTEESLITMYEWYSIPNYWYLNIIFNFNISDNISLINFLELDKTISGTTHVLSPFTWKVIQKNWDNLLTSFRYNYEGIRLNTYEMQFLLAEFQKLVRKSSRLSSVKITNNSLAPNGPILNIVIEK